MLCYVSEIPFLSQCTKSRCWKTPLSSQEWQQTLLWDLLGKCSTTPSAQTSDMSGIYASCWVHKRLGFNWFFHSISDGQLQCSHNNQALLSCAEITAITVFNSWCLINKNWRGCLCVVNLCHLSFFFSISKMKHKEWGNLRKITLIRCCIVLIVGGTRLKAGDHNHVYKEWQTRTVQYNTMALKKWLFGLTLASLLSAGKSQLERGSASFI